TLSKFLFGNVASHSGGINGGDYRLENVDIHRCGLCGEAREDAGQRIAVPGLSKPGVSRRIYDDTAIRRTDQHAFSLKDEDHVVLCCKLTRGRGAILYCLRVVGA